MVISAVSSSKAFLRDLGVVELAPATTPFDPGYDPITVEGHLVQSAHLMAGLKISMACWMIADENETRRKVAAARRGKGSTGCGATTVVIEARESAESVGLFDAGGALDGALADRFAAAFSLEKVVFEAPTKGSQFALINHFGPQVRLGNVRLEELLRVEIYRRGLHSDAFGLDKLRPGPPPEDRAPH